jgi:transcriptional regulator GlxA family with amidase domain
MRRGGHAELCRPRALASRQAIVERAEAYLRAHLDRPVPVSRLSRIVGLSERGLRNAFYTVRGVGPKRSMLAERLRYVRHALTDPTTRPATVTDVATEYGFYELGRFAGCYRDAFGEAPSDTLRVAGRQPATELTNTKRAHRCLHEPAG